jgi:ribosomal protein S18 acetylase RimI-like enzyme
MTYSLSFEDNPHSDDIRRLDEGIMAYAKKMKDHKPISFFGIFIRDEKGDIQGGLGGEILYGQMFVGHLWLKEELRGQGYGTQLMHNAEKYAKEMGCKFIGVNTMDWEALGFYQKLGFFIEFERHGFEKDSVFYFLRKNLI